MNTLSEALFELRVHVLIRIARMKNIQADEDAVRQIAAHKSDTLVVEELRAKRRSLRWVVDWFRR